MDHALDDHDHVAADAHAIALDRGAQQARAPHLDALDDVEPLDARAHASDIPLREAAFELGIERVVEAATVRGYIS